MDKQSIKTTNEGVWDADYLNEADFTSAEKEQVSLIAQQIDITMVGEVLHYGSDAQTTLTEFAQTALDSVRTKELGQIGDMLASLAGELKDFECEKEGFLDRIRGKSKNRIDTLKLRYGKAEKSVEKIVATLQAQQIGLMKDIAVCQQMYDYNLQNLRQLTLYIIAGKKKLTDISLVNLPALQKKAEESALPEDAQAVRDMISFCDRFEKRLFDLELTRNVALQMGPQLRLLQNNDSLMAQKIQSALCNTIPLWKGQMVIALGLEHSARAVDAQKTVADITNNLLIKNAEMLKAATLETAREGQRGIVDIETLQATNKMLLETLDGLAEVQREGREKRKNANAELGRIETQLKSRLMAGIN